MSMFRRMLIMAASVFRSCFGSGVWRAEKPWIGTDKWKNRK